MKHWLPLASSRKCCSSGSISTFEINRRKEYPKNVDDELCLNFVQTGECSYFETNGYCKFKHPPVCGILSKSVKRCTVCTLPSPCNVHFAVIGAELDGNDKSKIPNSEISHEPSEEIEKEEEESMEEDGNASFIYMEVVAAFYRGLWRYCYIIKDSKKTGLAKLVCREGSRSPRIFTVSRSTIYKLHGLKYHSNALHEENL